MLTHRLIWDAIDKLAESHGLSASGLARKAGLDPTTFNRSKRIGRNGKQRWPTTESLSKVLHATGTTLTDLLSEIDSLSPAQPSFRVPILPRSSVSLHRAFDGGGKPAGTDWMVGDALPVSDPAAFGVEVPDGRFQPYFRPGNLFVVSPGAVVRQGDLVFMHMRMPHGALNVREVVDEDIRTLTVKPVEEGDGVEVLHRDDIGWYSRIVFSSF